MQARASRTARAHAHASTRLQNQCVQNAKCTSSSGMPFVSGKKLRAGARPRSGARHKRRGAAAAALRGRKHMHKEEREEKIIGQRRRLHARRVVQLPTGAGRAQVHRQRHDDQPGGEEEEDLRRVETVSAPDVRTAHFMCLRRGHASTPAGQHSRAQSRAACRQGAGRTP